jgi:hypothetical protein
MSARSNTLRLAIVGLLIARAPKWVQRPLAFVLLGFVLAIVLIVLGVAAHGAACHPDCGPNGEDWERQSDIVCGR